MVICTSCKREVNDERFGVCFECAQDGEKRAAKRSVLQHVQSFWKHIKTKKYEYAKYDITWAFQRLFRVGDYKKDGYFDLEGYDWR